MKIKLNKLSKIILSLCIVTSIIYFVYGVLRFKTFNFNEFQIEEMGSFGADSPLYKVITSLFLSGDIKHLLLNLISMIFLIKILQSELSESDLVVGFFLSGVVANLVSVYMNPATYVYGLSGGVYGLLGMLFFCKVLLGVINALLKQKNHYLEIAVYFILIISFLLNIGGDKNINMIGHATGFCSGVIVGVSSYIITEWRKNYAEKRG